MVGISQQSRPDLPLPSAAIAEPTRSRTRFGWPFRRVRRPLRRRSLDGGDRRGHRRLREGTRRPGLPGHPGLPAGALRRPAVATVRGATAVRARRRGAHLPQARRPEPHRFSQDQQRARSGVAGPANGQDAGDRRDRRRSARRGDRHRVRLARPGLCHLHGRRGHRAPGAQRGTACGCWEPAVVSVQSGSKTLKDAINEAFRDWVTNADNTYYCFGTAAGPHPFPAMVRDFQRIIGLRDARPDPGPGGPVARRGGGLYRWRIQRDRNFPPVHRRSRRAADRIRGGRRRRRNRKARRDLQRRFTRARSGSFSYLLQDDDGQTIESHSISAGLDYPGVGPDIVATETGARRVPRPSPTAEAMNAFRTLCPPKASSRPSNPRTRSPGRSSSDPSWAEARSSW